MFFPSDGLREMSLVGWPTVFFISQLFLVSLAHREMSSPLLSLDLPPGLGEFILE